MAAKRNLVRRARNCKEKSPHLVCDGEEMQGMMAFNKEILKRIIHFTELVNGDTNTPIFPNLAAGNIAYNLLQEIGGADSIGLVILGLNETVHVLQLGLHPFYFQYGADSRGGGADEKQYQHPGRDQKSNVVEAF